MKLRNKDETLNNCMIGIKVPVCDRDFNLKVNRQKFPVTKIAFLNNLLKEK